ncbi:hypothetical protein XELAEV_18047260mg [Xenopus laevis]|uniref:exodeoxyribonuclease III n=1 Tax=Xenopus laevis TaxID=8355 RepID=A0A974BV03_XENLA|nr:hypothetical protein XELAEV_18047260mg [Xenopus laevis]
MATLQSPTITEGKDPRSGGTTGGAGGASGPGPPGRPRAAENSAKCGRSEGVGPSCASRTRARPPLVTLLDPRTTSGHRSFDLKVGSHNVNGFNVPQKRTMAFSDYTKQRIDILLLQETHFSKTSTPKYLSKHYPQVFMANSTTKTKGTFFKTFFTKLSEISEGRVIVGGDFNTTLSNNIDRSRDILNAPSPTNQDQDTKSLTKHLKEGALVDVWREKHPIDRDYTFYSSVHATYLRIDFILTKYTLLQYIHSSKLHNITWSDHGMVETIFTKWDAVRGGGSWRLNESLLLDRHICTELNNSLKEYFKNNTLTDTSLAIRWDAHKAVIRGILIKHASCRKKITEETTFTKIT